MRQAVFFKFLLVLILLSACQKKKWKKPVHIACSLELTDSNTGLVKIHYGSFIVKEIDFDGSRKQGANSISFNKKLETEAAIYTPYYQSSYTSTYTFYYSSYYASYTQLNPEASPEITFDIPQGTYSQFNLDLKLKINSANQSLVLYGTYTNSFQIKIPVVFSLDIAETISSSASNGEIVFVEGNDYKASIVFNTANWFESVSQNMFENANLTTVGFWPWGNKVMYINKNENSAIYDLIVGRIRTGNEIVISKP